MIWYVDRLVFIGSVIVGLVILSCIGRFVVCIDVISFLMLVSLGWGCIVLLLLGCSRVSS